MTSRDTEGQGMFKISLRRDGITDRTATGTGKATNFKISQNNNRVNPNKSP